MVQINITGDKGTKILNGIFYIIITIVVLKARRFFLKNYPNPNSKQKEL